MALGRYAFSGKIFHAKTLKCSSEKYAFRRFDFTATIYYDDKVILKHEICMTIYGTALQNRISIMNHLKLTENKLDPTEIHNLLSDSACGGVSLFIGITRDNFNGKEVKHLEYECYNEMAMKQMKEICDQIRIKWPEVKNISIHHRLGSVPIKEISIIVGTSSPHRTDAINATSWCIDQVKSQVPIWKKETYVEDTSDEWKANPECFWLK